MRIGKTVSWSLGVAVSVAMALPAPLRAGDKEWARVGKVLTGLAAVGAVAYAVRPPPPPSVYVPCYPSASERVIYVEREPVIIRERVAVVLPSTPSRRWGYSEWGRSSCEDGTREIVIQTEPGRRLYQPAVRGHIAFVQEWDSCRREWVTKGSHPSIWR